MQINVYLRPFEKDLNSFLYNIFSNMVLYKLLHLLTFISAPFCCQDFLCIQLYVSMLIVFYLNDFINAEPTQNERKFYILRNNIKDICKSVRINSSLFL